MDTDTTTRATRTPPADRTRPLPVLSRGRHGDAESGVCLMEFAALLAGEDLTDRPGCVHPLVAAVARVVNDSLGDGVRDGLLARVPALPGTTDDVRIADGIALSAVEAALPVALPIWAPRLRRERRRLLRRLGQPTQPMSARRMRRQERTVTIAAACLAFAPLEHLDGGLLGLLDDVVAVAGAGGRAETGHPGVR